MTGIGFPKPVPRAPMRPGQQRRKYINARSKTRVRIVDTARRDWCRSQSCVAGDMGSPYAFTGPCSPRIEAHHAGKNPGLGKRAPEDTLVPLCSRHHRAITGQVGGYGMFEAMGKDRRREMQDAWIAETTARYLSAGSRRGR